MRGHLPCTGNRRPAGASSGPRVRSHRRAQPPRRPRPRAAVPAKHAKRARHHSRSDQCVLVAGANEEGAVSRTYDDGQTWSYPVVAPRYERASRLLPTADLARWSRPTQHELPRQLRRHRHVRRLDRALTRAFHERRRLPPTPSRSIRCQTD